VTADLHPRRAQLRGSQHEVVGKPRTLGVRDGLRLLFALARIEVPQRPDQRLDRALPRRDRRDVLHA
jgi:hypothetical protein